MIGGFRVTGGKDGLYLLVYGPRDISEAKAGVPQAAFAISASDKMAFDQEKLASFLNAAVSMSHGNYAPMNKLCPPSNRQA